MMRYFQAYDPNGKVLIDKTSPYPIFPPLMFPFNVAVNGVHKFCVEADGDIKYHKMVVYMPPNIHYVDRR